MAEHKEREHFIPLRRNDLIELLCAEKDLNEEDRNHFGQFCRLITATYHFQYNQNLEELKAAYAPFDPDADTKTLHKLTAEEKQQRLNHLMREFTWLLDRANFRHLSQDDLEPSLHAASAWGVNMDVDFGVFENLAIFARGDSVQTRSRRRLGNFYRLEETEVPVYQRLVLILKMRPHKRLGDDVDTDGVYLKVFKDIPKQDVKMLLPGAKVRMTYFDQGKIGFPLLSGVGMAIYNIGWEFINVITRTAANPSLAVWGVATGAVGYGTKSFFSYQGTKQRYHLTLTQSLYYQNLDSNAGVLFRLLDEAEEQDGREAILAYYFLWRHAGEKGWTGTDLDHYVELYLENNADLEVDFEIGDALKKLEKVRLVEKIDDRYRAAPIGKALERLDWMWDNAFRFNRNTGSNPP